MRAMGASHDYYRILGVSHTASAGEIRAAFRDRAMHVHPDHTTDAGAEAEFRLLREAYDVLRDPHRRMAYDAARVTTEAKKGGQAPQERLFDRLRSLLAQAPSGPLVTGVMTVLLVLSLVLIWSDHRQLAERAAQIGELQDRVDRLVRIQAELRARYRSQGFLELEQALAQGGQLPGDATRFAFTSEIGFAPGATGMGERQLRSLDHALMDLARRIEAIPPGRDWLVVLETQSDRASHADEPAVESWEPALLRLHAVIDGLLARGLPGERLAVRFHAGFADTAAALSVVEVKLLCCGD